MTRLGVTLAVIIGVLTGIPHKPPRPTVPLQAVETVNDPKPPPAPHTARERAHRPLNWRALAYCEASGNPKAVDPTGTYFGLYEFDLPTWRSVGGRGNPADASPAEQTYRAQLLYAQRGRAPWPQCGSRL